MFVIVVCVVAARLRVVSKVFVACVFALVLVCDLSL